MTLQRLILFLALPMISLYSQSGFAQEDMHPYNKYITRFYPQTTVQILVAGKPIPVSPTGTFTFPKYGEKYSIRIKNLDRRRIAAVVTVDGLSVMNGRPANPTSRGYVIPPYGSYTITGWRIDSRFVKEFVVTRPTESEAAKQGLLGETGQIRVTAIAERVRFQGGFGHPFPPQGQPQGGWGHPFPPFDSNSYLRSQAGTAAGQQMVSAVQQVAFQRDPHLITRQRYRYFVAGDAERKSATR